MRRIHQTTPFLHVPDLARALDLLTRVLRFEVKHRERDYAYLEWEAAALRVLEDPGRPRADPARVTVYLDCVDVDALYAELRPGLEALPPGDVEPPRDRPWRQREFQVRLPDGNWLAFGMPVRPGRGTS